MTLRFDLPDDASALGTMASGIARRIGAAANVGTPMVGALGPNRISVRVFRKGSDVQEGRSRMRVAIALDVPLRSFFGALHTHQHVAMGFPSLPLGPPLGQKYRLDVAPRDVAARVFDGEVQALIAAIDAGSKLGIETLTIGQGAVRFDNDAPSDEASLDAVLRLMQLIAARIPPAIDAIVGPGGTLAAHPDVVQALRAGARGRAVAFVVLVLVLAVVAAVIFFVAR